MGKDAKATFQKGKVLSFVPTGEYYFKKGLKAYHRHDFTKAKRYLQRAMQLEPGEPMIACQLAIISTELGEYENSNQLLHLILEELDEEMTECHYFLANNYAHMGLFKDSYQHAKLYLELDQEGDFAEETEELLELLEMESEDLDEELYEQDDLIIKQEKARELLELGYFPKAIELLNTVIETYPEYWSAYNNLALAYFYMGDVERAEDILKDVLERNPGNLHALCNQLVFAHYLQQSEKMAAIMKGLKKIQPLLAEHQFKLGATFALVGEYEHSYNWLKKLYKQGFEEDGPFYYWLAYAAYFTGHENFSRNVWKKVLEFNREKEGLEPWSDKKEQGKGHENHQSFVLPKLESEYIEERLFALFLISLSPKKEELLASIQLGKLTVTERHYLTLLKEGKPPYANIIEAHRIAERLYEFHQPFGIAESGLYILWFSIFIELSPSKENLTNHGAWAAAVEYVWNKLRREKGSQKEIAERYGLSLSTVRKYVKKVQKYL